MNKNKRKSNHNYSCTKYVEGRANKRTSTGCKQIEELPDLVENHNQSVKSHPSTTKYSHQPTILHYISVEKQKSKVRRQDNSRTSKWRSDLGQEPTSANKTSHNHKHINIRMKLKEE